MDKVVISTNEIMKWKIDNNASSQEAALRFGLTLGQIVKHQTKFNNGIQGTSLVNAGVIDLNSDKVKVKTNSNVVTKWRIENRKTRQETADHFGISPHTVTDCLVSYNKGEVKGVFVHKKAKPKKKTKQESVLKEVVIYSNECNKSEVEKFGLFSKLRKIFVK